MSSLVKIAGVQMDIAIGQNAVNLDRMLERFAETSATGAMLTVFPECALPGYCFESLAEAIPLAETIPGPSTARFTDACRDAGALVAYGLLERDGERLFNACALVGPQGLVASYRKVHLPYLGIDRFTTPGDRPFSVHEIGPLRIGLNICYDSAFPEAARTLALEGADLIVLPTNFPPGGRCVCDHVINARAMENGVYFISVNRVGTEGGFPFIGRSKICDTDGNTIAEADHDGPAVLYAEIDPARARDKHRVRVPGKHEIDRFRDRRPEMYERLRSR